MNSCIENIIDYFKPFLLSDITIKTDKKRLRRGKLKIFQVKQHYIRMTLDVDGKIKMYEIPYPFKVSRGENDSLLLNYHLSSIFQDSDLLLRSKLLDNTSKSKIYDDIVYVLKNT